VRAVRAFEAEVNGAGHVRVRVFHACPEFHCGRVIGANIVGSWWAERGVAGWVYLWNSDNLTAQAWLEEVITAALPSPADVARRAQDERYEAPDA